MGHKIYLKNVETGEEKVFIDKAEAYRHPWKLDRVEKYLDPDSQQGRIDAKIAVWAQKLGLPVAQFFDLARLILEKDCPFCQMGTKILKTIDDIGEERAHRYLSELLNAKERKDFDTLARIRNELWSSGQPE